MNAAAKSGRQPECPQNSSTPTSTSKRLTDPHGQTSGHGETDGGTNHTGGERDGPDAGKRQPSAAKQHAQEKG